MSLSEISLVGDQFKVQLTIGGMPRMSVQLPHKVESVIHSDPYSHMLGFEHPSMQQKLTEEALIHAAHNVGRYVTNHILDLLRQGRQIDR